MTPTFCAQDADDHAKLTAQVTEQRKRYDDLKQLAQRRAGDLKKRLDNVKASRCHGFFFLNHQTLPLGREARR